jgi:pimeloyl-ACP methyl ester carboxylesterase
MCSSTTFRMPIPSSTPSLANDAEHPFEREVVIIDGVSIAIARTCLHADRIATVVAVHGFGTTGYRTYRHVASLLAEQRIELIAPDLPGFGDSDAPDVVYSLEYYSDILASIAAHLKLDQPVLLGHSMGGKIASAAAVRHGDIYSALALVNPGGFAPGERLLPFIAAHPVFHWLLQADWFYYRVLPRTVLGPIFHSDENRKQMVRLRSAHVHLDLKRSGYRDRLKSLELPSLLLWGRDDRILPFRTTGRIERCIPRLSTRLIAHAGHAPMKDQPRQFANELGNWIRSLSPVRLEADL